MRQCQPLRARAQQGLLYASSAATLLILLSSLPSIAAPVPPAALALEQNRLAPPLRHLQVGKFYPEMGHDNSLQYYKLRAFGRLWQCGRRLWLLLTCRAIPAASTGLLWRLCCTPACHGVLRPCGLYLWSERPGVAIRVCSCKQRQQLRRRLAGQLLGRRDCAGQCHLC